MFIHSIIYKYTCLVRKYTPLGVLITRTFSPAAIQLLPLFVLVLVPGICIATNEYSVLIYIYNTQRNKSIYNVKNYSI